MNLEGRARAARAWRLPITLWQYTFLLPETARPGTLIIVRSAMAGSENKEYLRIRVVGLRTGVR